MQRRQKCLIENGLKEGEGRGRKKEDEEEEGRREEGRKEKTKEDRTQIRMSDDSVSKQGTTCSIILWPLMGEEPMEKLKGARDV